MAIAKVTSKHQITIPSGVRQSLGLRKGDCIAFEGGTDGAFQIRRVNRKKSDGAAVVHLKKRGRALAPEDMKMAIAKGALESYLARNQ